MIMTTNKHKTIIAEYDAYIDLLIGMIESRDTTIRNMTTRYDDLEYRFSVETGKAREYKLGAKTSQRTLMGFGAIMPNGTHDITLCNDPTSANYGLPEFHKRIKSIAAESDNKSAAKIDVKTDASKLDAVIAGVVAQLKRELTSEENTKLITKFAVWESGKNPQDANEYSKWAVRMFSAKK